MDVDGDPLEALRVVELSKTTLETAALDERAGVVAQPKESLKLTVRWAAR